MDFFLKVMGCALVLCMGCDHRTRGEDRKAGPPTAETNATSARPTAISRPTYWGETNAGLQLSLTVEPEKIKSGGEITLHLKARNHIGTNIVLDARVPYVNGSQITVVCPDGRRTGHHVWFDQYCWLTIAPGETNFGHFATVSLLDLQEYNPKKEGHTKFDTKRLQGVHKITWHLGKTTSNTAQVTVD